MDWLCSCDKNWHCCNIHKFARAHVEPIQNPGSQNINQDVAKVIKKAYDTFNFNHYVVKKVDKKAYLSALAISDHIVVTCDSTSMISEAAVTEKPVYIAMMKSIKNNYRFKKFYDKTAN